jgi:hypothetical protein
MESRFDHAPAHVIAELAHVRVGATLMQHPGDYTGRTRMNLPHRETIAELRPIAVNTQP